jgi:hypothetical protein
MLGATAICVILFEHLGFGSTFGYMRDGVSAREFFDLQRLAGHYGRQTGAHFRYTPKTDTTEANSIQELLANAAALSAPALACHFNNPGCNLVHELLVRIRERGVNVWGEIYPYAKALRLARENNIPLMQIIAMTNYNSARPRGKMGLKAMQERGRLQKGMVADITIFDPQKVTDKATYEKGTIPSTGIPHVVVNGTIEALYNHWMLGEAAKVRRPTRWSVIRDARHWVE